MTQNRPVPSFVVFGSLSDRRTCDVLITSPGRTGVWKATSLSLITASGRPRTSLRSKCTCSGSRGTDWPGCQWCGRNHSERVDGGATGPPVRSSATASSQNSGFPFSTEAQDVQM